MAGLCSCFCLGCSIDAADIHPRSFVLYLGGRPNALGGGGSGSEGLNDLPPASLVFRGKDSDSVNPSSDPSDLSGGAGGGGGGFPVLPFIGISVKPFAFLELKPLFHILIPNIMATMILTAGNTTPMAIVPLVLKPPLLPDAGAADFSGGGEAASDEDTGADAGEPVWLEVAFGDVSAFEEVLASGPHSMAKE